MFHFWLSLLLATAIATSIASHARAQSTNAPLYLSINGGGSVSPLTNGQLLVVGQSYNMVATPDSGSAFVSWQPVNVFTFTTYTIDASGNTNIVVSVVPSLVPNYSYQPSLDFVMQPVTVISDVPGVRTITEGNGWQANFEPLVLNIQLGESAVILTWPTNFVAYTLQSTTNLGPLAIWSTNFPAAMVINDQYTITNPISGTQQFFRLSQ